MKNSRRLVAGCTAIISVGATMLTLTGCAVPSDDAVLSPSSAAQVGDSSWSSTIPSTVPLAPDPGPSVNSFSYSAVQEVAHTSHATVKFGCPVGFYVRPGSGDVWGDTTPEPLDKTFVGNTVLMQQTQGDQLLYPYSGTSGGETLYQGVEEGYWNAGTSTHHFTLTVWCDRIANLTAPEGATQTDTPAPTATAAAPAPSSPKQIGNNGAFNAALQNVGTGEYLDAGSVGDTADMTNGPTTMYFAGDQEGNGNDIYNAFAYGVWSPGDNNFVGPNLGFQGNTPVWYSPGSGTANGGVLLPVFGNATGSQMLVQASSITVPDDGNVPDKTVGSGGQCLAAPSDGGAPTLEACDATNPNQYWNFDS